MDQSFLQIIWPYYNLWGKLCYPHFTNEKGELQSLPFTPSYTSMSELGLSLDLSDSNLLLMSFPLLHNDSYNQTKHFQVNTDSSPNLHLVYAAGT